MSARDGWTGPARELVDALAPIDTSEVTDRLAAVIRSCRSGGRMAQAQVTTVDVDTDDHGQVVLNVKLCWPDDQKGWSRVHQGSLSVSAARADVDLDAAQDGTTVEHADRMAARLRQRLDDPQVERLARQARAAQARDVLTRRVVAFEQARAQLLSAYTTARQAHLDLTGQHARAATTRAVGDSWAGSPAGLADSADRLTGAG